MRYIIWGYAAVFGAGDLPVEDPSVVRQLAGYVDEDDLYATDYIGGTPEEDAIAAALLRSGQIRFEAIEGQPVLRITTSYDARRPLAPAESEWLREYTMGQWSDGMGECLFVRDGQFAGYHIQPLMPDEVEAADYPFVEVREATA